MGTVSWVTQPQGGRRGSVGACAVPLSLLHLPQRSLTSPSLRVPQLTLTLMLPCPIPLPGGVTARAGRWGSSSHPAILSVRSASAGSSRCRRDPLPTGSPRTGAGAPPAPPEPPAARTPPPELCPPPSEPFSFSGDRFEIANTRGEFPL